MPRRSLWPVLLGVSSLIVGVLAQPPQKPPRGSHQTPLLPRKELLYLLSGYQQLVADYFWIQTIHAVGEAGTQEEYRDIYYYADITTDLDPKLRFAYVFAGCVIPYNLGREHWVNTNESTQLLRKGLQYFPDYVFLRILLAFNLSYFQGAYKEAADLLVATSRLPDAPQYLPALATRLYAQAGSFDSGLALSASLAESATDPETRAAFERRTQEIQLERDLQRIDSAIAAFKARTGKLPPDIPTLLREKDLAPPAPADPLGGELYIGKDGRGHSTSAGHRLEIYTGLEDASEH